MRSSTSKKLDRMAADIEDIKRQFDQCAARGEAATSAAMDANARLTEIEACLRA